jgi:DUF1009 family protein
MTHLAIIAGRGVLPLQVAKAAAELGYEVFIFAIEGQADAVFDGFKVKSVRLGAIGQIQRQLNACGCGELVMVGTVSWPSLAALRPDVVAIRLLSKLVRRGDDSVLRVIAQYFAEHGITTLPVSKFLADRAMPLGHVAGPPLDADGQTMIEIGVDLLDRLGNSDVGQAVVVQNGRILAIEAAEGTSAMLARSAELIDSHAGVAVFVKMKKLGQDQRLDTPFIGGDTLQVAVVAGIHVLAVEAGAVMLADDLPLISDLCEEHRLTFVGISATAQK